MSNSLFKPVSKTNFIFPNQVSVYHGKVRDVYDLGDYLVIVATDRISAFDHILPNPIPGKGQVLNQLAAYNLQKTEHLVPNWWIASPHPQVSIGKKCTPFKIEMVVRAYLTGHAWRTYKSGARTLCGITLEEGMVENQKFAQPILTPSTKADEGHDLDISRDEIIATGLASESDYTILEQYALLVFAEGNRLAAERGLILVDTKYEFGKDKDGRILLIDEIHTPDSSRYFYADDYEKSMADGKAPSQLSKEFVREWLMAHGFNGGEGQIIPEMPQTFIQEVTRRYTELYRLITGHSIEIQETNLDELQQSVIYWLANNQL